MSDNDRTSSGSNGATVLQMPARAVRTTAERLPGTGIARGVVDGVLDTVSWVPPRTRRMTAYAGAGLLAVAGVVDWPVAAAGAAAVWLTQAHRHDRVRQEETRDDQPRADQPGHEEAGAEAARRGKTASRPDDKHLAARRAKAARRKHHAG